MFLLVIGTFYFSLLPSETRGFLYCYFASWNIQAWSYFLATWLMCLCFRNCCTLSPDLLVRSPGQHTHPLFPPSPWAERTFSPLKLLSVVWEFSHVRTVRCLSAAAGLQPRVWSSDYLWWRSCKGNFTSFYLKNSVFV